MKNLTTSTELLPGVYCVTDRMGMNMTLLVGTEKALLIDTGYGFDDLRDAARQVTGLPLMVINTHGHHDHACGNNQFEQVYIAAADIPICEKYVKMSRLRIWQQAESQRIPLDDWTPETYSAGTCGTLMALTDEQIRLGGLSAQILKVPGHTPGSLAVYVPERSLMLTGDDWNPTTWLFFPEAEGVPVLRESIARMLEKDFEWVLPSHDAKLWPRSALETFFRATAPEFLRKHAEEAPSMYPGKRIRVIHPQPDCAFFYDEAKAEGEKK